MRRSLFLKIFLWFWLAIGLLVLAIVVTFVTTETEPVTARWRDLMGRALQFQAVTATQIYERDGERALAEYLKRLETTTLVRGALLDAGGRAIGGVKPPPGIEPLMEATRRTGRQEAEFYPDRTLAALQFESASGKSYVFVVEVLGGFLNRFRVPPRVRLLRVLAVLLTAGLVCYGLARHLTRPIVALRAATQRLAGGDLSTRIGASPRRDELAELGSDFDRMAERIEGLVKAQQRLVGDISHELRSPLARLGVALELARQKAGGEAGPALDRIGREADRLNELIGQLLTLARIESGTQAASREPVELDRLVREIAADAQFEAAGRNRAVRVLQCDECRVEGNAELLRRAIENGVRNAVRYTGEATEVEVALRRVGAEAQLTVRDHGAGVPEASLPQLFEPFYRVADARDRQTGGIGLGLSITDRAIRFHGGSVRAENAPGGGLRITLALPVVRPS
ncbi:MAG: ATP-binding protein [Blastocatellia bacterium]|nr:ATP-binding protein [Blastocatellia bacterium]